MSGTAAQNVLVTGAAGFIGSTLVDRLLAQGRTVIALDSFDPFYSEDAKRRNLASALDHAHFRLVRGDIRDPAALALAFGSAEIDAVVHLAALAGVRPSLERPALYADVNVHGTAQVFEAAVRVGCPAIVFASSSSVYGERDGGPFREDEPAISPISPYAATKRAGELLAHSFHHARGIEITCARIFTAYGPRQRPDLAVRRFAERMRAGLPVLIYGDGGALRDFTYIDDLVEGLVRALDRPAGFRVLNFGAGRTLTVLEVVKQLEQALGVSAEIERLPRETGDVTRTWADVSAARAALGWSPRVPFEEGVRRFVAWLEAEA
jgi:UDP-glucuronate 4-epimerase